MRILVIDLCGTHVKLLVTRHKKRVKIPTSPNMTAVKMVAVVRAATVIGKYNAVSIGNPGSVVQGYPFMEPCHLGRDWVGLDSKKVFARPASSLMTRRGGVFRQDVVRNAVRVRRAH